MMAAWARTVMKFLKSRRGSTIVGKSFSKGNAFTGLLVLRDFLLDSGHNLPVNQAPDLIKFATSNSDDPSLTIMIKGYLK